jgi:hypothetical protein
MMLIPIGLDRKWDTIYKQHQYLVNSCNIYFNTIKLINGKHKLLDRDGFVEYYKNILEDIELTSHPIDLFIPNEKMDEELESQDGTVPQIVVVSRETPEYERIKKRINLDDLYATIPETHPVHMELKKNPGKLDIVIDDIVTYWCLYKFMHHIEMVHLKEISAMKPVIEYVVENIDIDKWKEFLTSTRRINDKKVNKWMEDNFFGPDYEHTCNFYQSESVENQAIVIDVMNLLRRMCSNIVFNSDIYIIIAVYLILSFSKVDIKEGNFDGSPCAKYVQDVISQL